ncbi:MAG TPA: hypothetical protein VG757_10465 [Devosia sp.]|nr:hypothetical protein [Devosia sp.]
MKSFKSVAIAGLVVLAAVAPAAAAGCSMSQAKIVATDYIKILETLPKTSSTWRFLGEDHDTKKTVGGIVNMQTCTYSQVSGAETQKPWCQYLPDQSDRC